MSDPRNVAHDKKVIQEKLHHGEDVAEGLEHAPQPGKKSPAIKQEHEPSGSETEPEAQADPTDKE